MGVALELSTHRNGMSSHDFCDLGMGRFLAKESSDGKTLFEDQVIVGHLCLVSVLQQWFKTVSQALIRSFPIRCTFGLNPRKKMHKRNNCVHELWQISSSLAKLADDGKLLPADHSLAADKL